MEAAKKKVGRPKASPRTRPLVLEDDADRVKLEIEITETTASDLKEYVRWVELSSSLTTAEAISKTIDFALRKVFQRDRLWQEARRGSPPANGAPDTARAPSPAPASLPPPAASGARAPRPAES